MSPAEPSTTPCVLQGLRVVELGRRVAAPIVGMLLAEQGAEVLRVLDAACTPEDPVLDAMLARGKTELVLDLASEGGRGALLHLLAHADVFVENLAPGEPRRLGIDLDVLREANPALVSCSVPNFPEGDPHEDLPDHEALVGTVGYLYAKPIGAPQVHDFPLGSALGALFAADGILAALIARLRTGRGQHVRAALVHADLFAQVVLILMQTGIPRGFLPLKMVGTPFMGSWLCGDGRYIYLHISLPAHNARILEILEQNGHAEEVRELRGILSEDTIRDPSQVRSIPEAKAIKEVYERIFRSRTAEAWEQILGKELCCIKVRTVEEWVQDSIAAGMADACAIEDPRLGDLMGPGASVTLLERPPRVLPRVIDASVDAILARWSSEPRVDAERLARADEPELRHPLEGIRVMDLSRVIAGPCAARILAELGAEVLSVQSPSRLDWALSFHLLFNAGKKSVTLDFSDDAGKARLWALMEDFQPHAFLQNYRNMDLAREIGVHPEGLRARFPDIAYTHLNAYGNQGIWKDRPGFEQVVQAVSGIQVTYGRGGRPKLLPTPDIDNGTGLLGAFSALLGLYEQRRVGRGLTALTHLTRTAVLFQVLPLAESQRARCLEVARERGVPLGRDREHRVVAGILRARDAYFCVAGPRAVALGWLEREGLALPGAAEAANPLEHTSRRAWTRSVDGWKATLSAEDIAAGLRVLAVPRIKNLLRELPPDPASPVPPVRRRAYPGVPTELTFIGNPLRLSGTPLVDVAPPSMRGGDTREVLARIGEAPDDKDSVIPYPEPKPLLVWLGTLLRWGYFAWRSGNI
jgi:crotonobetainyl-CoA:carnitine CoA-transferase CaiB-like acyl-CoA transferase